jgi:hypothetical protein
VKFQKTPCGVAACRPACFVQRRNPKMPRNMTPYEIQSAQVLRSEARRRDWCKLVVACRLIGAFSRPRTSARLILLSCSTSTESFCSSVVLELARLNVARQNLALEVFLVAVPQYGCFAVERRCAGVILVSRPSYRVATFFFRSSRLTCSAHPTNSECSKARSRCSAPRSTRPPCPVRPASGCRGRCGRSCRRWGGRSGS